MRRDLGRMIIYCLITSIILRNIPAMFGITDLVVKYAIFLIVDLLLLLFVGNSLVRCGYFSKDRQTPLWKNLLILLPTLVLVIGFPISNLVYYNRVFSFDFAYFTELDWLILAQLIVTAIYDELLFRLILQYQWFGNSSRIQRIVFSALVFALFEALSLGIYALLVSIASIIVLFAGAFILGLVLGFFMEYTHSVYPCIIFHLLFAIFALGNESSALLSLVVFILGGETFEALSYQTDLFILAGCELFTVLYLFFTYNLYFKKKEY